MKINFKSIAAKEIWLKKPVSAGDYHRWLIDSGSLTYRLQKRHSNFQVQPISMQYAKLFNDEKKLLSFKSVQKALIRRVVLASNLEPVVFAHSVIPRNSLRGEWYNLNHLGSEPLGAALFTNPKVKRTSLAFKKLSRSHPLYQEAIKHARKPASYLWARRSIFSLNCAKILVTEVFLPSIND